MYIDPGVYENAPLLVRLVGIAILLACLYAADWLATGSRFNVRAFGGWVVGGTAAIVLVGEIIF